jgi:hypothetical protein
MDFYGEDRISFFSSKIVIPITNTRRPEMTDIGNERIQSSEICRKIKYDDTGAKIKFNKRNHQFHAGREILWSYFSSRRSRNKARILENATIQRRTYSICDKKNLSGIGKTAVSFRRRYKRYAVRTAGKA